jgi:hypothetical protein
MSLSQELAEPILTVSLYPLAIASLVGATSCFSIIKATKLSSPKITELTLGIEGDAFSWWENVRRWVNARGIRKGSDMREGSVKHEEEGVCVGGDVVVITITAGLANCNLDQIE